jgi:hypothetical protein
MKLPESSYVLVGRCLAPALDDDRRDALRQALQRTAIRWEDLLAEADRQHAAPLLYVRLKGHGLLDLLPAGLAAYLARRTAANRARNRKLQQELAAVLDRLAAHDIPVLLLKGAATLADKLYADSGARLIADLDLLIPRNRVAQARALLLETGYEEDAEAPRRDGSLALDAAHCHLAALRHPDKQTVIDLHSKVAYGQSGRVIALVEAWQAPGTGAIDSRPVHYLNPTLRLLNNALHATLRHLEFLYGRLALSDLAEFAALWHRYGEEIDRAILFTAVEKHHLQSEFTTYVQMANLLMCTEFRLSMDINTALHTRRILATAGRQYTSPVANAIKQAYDKVYYLSRLPRWAKQNVVHGDGDTPNWKRFGTMVGGLFNTSFKENAKL